MKSKVVNKKQKDRKVEYQLLTNILNFRNLRTNKTDIPVVANKYLPKSLDIIPAQEIQDFMTSNKSGIPDKVLQTEYLTAWHMKVLEFEMPK